MVIAYQRFRNTALSCIRYLETVSFVCSLIIWYFKSVPLEGFVSHETVEFAEETVHLCCYETNCSVLFSLVVFSHVTVVRINYPTEDGLQFCDSVIVHSPWPSYLIGMCGYTAVPEDGRTGYV